jgi:hypothetical protein
LLCCCCCCYYCSLDCWGYRYVGWLPHSMVSSYQKREREGGRRRKSGKEKERSSQSVRGNIV